MVRLALPSIQRAAIAPDTAYAIWCNHVGLVGVLLRPTLTHMPKRTTPSDADHINDASDLEMLVQDKREIWRATGPNTRRRQRRYKNLLTQQLLKRGGILTEPNDLSGDDVTDD